MTRAVLWLLPAIGVLTLIPVVAWKLSDPEVWILSTVLMAVAAAAAGGAALLFWQLALTEFEREGRS